jgi:hypothetical protein
MTCQTLKPPVKIYLTIAALLAVSTALVGSPPEPPPAEKKRKAAPEAEKNAQEQIRREAEEVIHAIDLEILREDDKWTKVERIDKPLLYYGDLTRQNDRGSVWGWHQKGRPVAVIELYQDLDNRRRWVFAICNTSGGKLRARHADTPWWLENESATELKDIPGAPAPAAEASVRQRQLKLLAQKFSGHQFWNPGNSRYELRLLNRPLYIYRDEANGALEGGLFTLANGTNPEILLFIEARVDPKDRTKRVWQYAVGRLAHAELHMEYEGKEIFEAPRGGRLSGPDRPYWVGFINIAPAIDPRRP